MRRQTLGVLAILLGLFGAGCSLAEVYPTVAGPTGGPSPYGAWYEQHWATNAVLLAAAHEQKYGPALNEEKSELDGPGPAATPAEPEAEPVADVSDEQQASPEPEPSHGCHRWWPCFGASSSSSSEGETWDYNAEPATYDNSAESTDRFGDAPASNPGAAGGSSPKVRY